MFSYILSSIKEIIDFLLSFKYCFKNSKFDLLISGKIEHIILLWPKPIALKINLGLTLSEEPIPFMRMISYILNCQQLNLQKSLRLRLCLSKRLRIRKMVK